jgi:hypothetical protein
MNRPYSYPTSTSRRAGAYGDYDQTEVIEDYDDYTDDDDGDDGYDPDEVYSYTEPIDRRWIWVAGAAGAVLLVAVICTVVILGGGDSGSVTMTYAPPSATSAAPSTSAQAPSRTPSMTPPVPLPTAPLTPETVTTVAPSPSAVAVPPTDVAPVPSPRTVTYQVTGNRQLIDLVTVIYTDAQGALQTDVNVALPWTKQVVLNPGVELSSVTATSMLGQLNCAITDASGATVVAQNNNTMITTCTK